MNVFVGGFYLVMRGKIACKIRLCSEKGSAASLIDLLGDTGLVEDEVASLLLIHICQVEGDANNIALHSIITFIIVIINDVEVPVLNRGRNILEIIEVERIAQDVVAMAALKRADLRLHLQDLLTLLLRVLECCLLFLGQDLDAELFS